MPSTSTLAKAPISTISTKWRHPTRTWNSVPSIIRDKAKPFDNNNVYEAENESSLHDRAKKANAIIKNWFGINNSNGAQEIPDEAELSSIIKITIDARRTKIGKTKVDIADNERRYVIQLAADLAVTNPHKTTIGSFEKGSSELFLSTMTVWWKSSINVFGCQYTEEPTTSPSKASQKTLTFANQKKQSRSTQKTNNIVRRDSINKGHQSPLKRSKAKVVEFSSDSDDASKTVQQTPKKGDLERIEELSDDSSVESTITETTANKKQPAKKSPSITPPPNVTPRQTTLQQPLRNVTERYDIKFTLPDDDTGAIVSLHQCITEWFDELKEIDETTILLPWAKKNKTEFIETSDQIPRQLHLLRKYFQGVNPQKRGNRITYGKIRVSMDSPSSMIVSGNESEMGWWYNSNGHALYKRALADAEYTKEIGWLAYSGNFTKVQETVEIVNKSLRSNGFAHPVGGRIRPIEKVSQETRDKYRDEGGQWMMQPWVALSLEVETRYARLAAKKMLELFNDEHKKQPGRLSCRFVPNLTVASLGTNSKEKIKIMIEKHKAVLKALEIVRIDGVVQIDTLDEESQTKSLREVMMEMKHSTTGRKLFHSIDLTTSTIGETDVAFATVMPEHSMEANNISALLPVICKRKVNESTDRWFTEEFNDLVSDYTFDKETGEYKSASLDNFDKIIQENMGQEVEITGIDILNTQNNTSNSGDDSTNLSFTTFHSDIGGPRKSRRPGRATTIAGGNTAEGEWERMTRENKRLREHLLQAVEPANSSTVSGVQQ